MVCFFDSHFLLLNLRTSLVVGLILDLLAWMILPHGYFALNQVRLDHSQLDKLGQKTESTSQKLEAVNRHQ